MIRLKSWALSDIGKKRGKNEDAYYHNATQGLFVVADGMGGHLGGDRAANLAVNSTVEYFTTHLDSDHEAIHTLEKAVKKAAHNVYQEGKENTELRGMGTTLSALLIKNQRAHICHIGDSRVYCIRENSIHQLTSDHSLVNEQVQAGIMSPEEARSSSLRNIITRALGQDPAALIDSFSLPVKNLDTYLLCTDGLNNMLYDREILEIINKNKLNISINNLISESNLRGGFDNITAILVKIC